MTDKAMGLRKFLVFSLSFTFCALSFTIIHNAYALNLDTIKVSFLNGDYKSAISDGERILAGSSGKSGHSDELYYLLGLSYLKDGNYLRASDIFEIILKEFKDSKFKEEAKLGLADTYFLQDNYDQAEGYYREITSSNRRTKLQPLIYYRLSQIGFKKGDTQQAKEYLNKLKQGFPLNLETRLNKDLYISWDFYYTVQVGSFSSITNANNLAQRLIQKGYPAYIEETGSPGKISYRVRIGKLRLRKDAISLEEKLSQEGYPTKIYP